MGFQLLYWHYLKSINHPFLKILDQSPQSFVGEDIELSLMLLSNYTATTPLTRDNKDTSASYKKLSLLAEIAKNVRDYKISRFGGYTAERAPVSYSLTSPEVTAATNFVRTFIEKTEEYGLYTYKLEGKKNLISKRENAHKTAKRYKNVPHIDLNWTTFAETMITRHLRAFVSPPFKVATQFDKSFLSKFADRYSFDETSLGLFSDEHSSDSDSSGDDLPLNSEEWRKRMQDQMAADYTVEAKVRNEVKRAARRKQRSKNSKQPIRANQRSSTAESKQCPSPQLASSQKSSDSQGPAKKRGPGRPPGSRNKKTLALLGMLNSAELERKEWCKQTEVPEPSSARSPPNQVFIKFLMGLMFAIAVILTLSIQQTPA